MKHVGKQYSPLKIKETVMMLNFLNDYEISKYLIIVKMSRYTILNHLMLLFRLCQIYKPFQWRTPQ
jgi:hypothetical protein